MYEHLSPTCGQQGLYDALATAVGVFEREIVWSTSLIRCEVSGETLDKLVDDIVKALHNDNEHFNEARFRRQINDILVSKLPK